MLQKHSESFQFGSHQVTLETGAIARQASGAVMISMGDTVVLVTVVGVPSTDAGRDFFPLTVNYQEKFYAVGRIPGGYFKREGRPTEKETLVSRLIDRPLRPMFSKGFTDEVQVIATVLSMDPEIDADIPAIIGASAAIALAGLPFASPVSAARVGYKEGEYLLNPSASELVDSDLDLVVAGTRDAVLMVESEADQLSEETMLGAVVFGHEQMQVAIDAIHALVEKAGSTAWSWTPATENTELKQKIAELTQQSLPEAYQIKEKLQRRDRLSEVRESLLSALCSDEDSTVSADEVGRLFHDLEGELVREQILSGSSRIDGRDLTTVRPIDIDMGVLPRTHGSAVFTRGETQALVVSTLGTERDAQFLDTLQGDFRDNFMLHYNFPPFSVGEARFLSGPKRREIGHGRLARRALSAVLPMGENEFPYTVRLVSEVTESNGSSSMATVCGGSLALMDAGVPIKSAVAGIAMGLIKDGDRFAVLTDILGDEDHLGDMDFKVAGTTAGVTALQMDIKITGITHEIMEKALDQAKTGRMHILQLMEQAIQAPREDVSQFAPRIITVKIHPDKIRDVIGKGGATIREITEATDSTIDISDDGVVKIASVDGAMGEKARQWVESIVAEAEVGAIYDASVVKIVDFGAFVEFLPGKQGLVHVSQIAEERVNDVRDYLTEGQAIKVKVVEVDRQGRVRLSMKEAVESTDDSTQGE